MKRRASSYTAERVARLASLGGKNNPGIIPADYLETIIEVQRACGILHPFHEFTAALRVTKASKGLLDRFILPGAQFHLPFRKRYIWDRLNAAIADECDSVINIGAGYDAALYALAKRYPNVTFWEFDHPLTSLRKQEGLESLADIPSNLHLVAVDLAKTPFKEVVAREIGAPKKSVLVAEGLLMYLEPQDVDQLLAGIRECVAKGSELVMTHIFLDDNGLPQIGKLGAASRVALQLIGEPMKWGINRNDVEKFLQERGYLVSDHPTAYELAESYLSTGKGTPIGLKTPPPKMLENFLCARTT